MKAFYDYKPAVLEAVGNGNHLYHYDIKEVEVLDFMDTAEATKRTQWECEEVTVKGQPTNNGITKAVITERFPSDYEQKLVNEYNAANLGVYGSPTSEEAKAKIAKYTAFLEERAALKKQIDADCAELGIK